MNIYFHDDVESDRIDVQWSATFEPIPFGYDINEFKGSLSDCFNSD